MVLHICVGTWRAYRFGGISHARSSFGLGHSAALARSSTTFRPEPSPPARQLARLPESTHALPAQQNTRRDPPSFAKSAPSRNVQSQCRLAAPCIEVGPSNQPDTLGSGLIEHDGCNHPRIAVATNDSLAVRSKHPQLACATVRVARGGAVYAGQPGCHQHCQGTHRLKTVRMRRESAHGLEDDGAALRDRVSLAPYVRPGNRQFAC